MTESQSIGDVIVCPSGPNRGIWCRTQEAFDTIAAAAAPFPQAKRPPTMPAPDTYNGMIVVVASAEKWRELEAALARAADQPEPARPADATAKEVSDAE